MSGWSSNFCSSFVSIFIFISIPQLLVPLPSQPIFCNPTDRTVQTHHEEEGYLQQGDLPDGVAGAQANPLGDGPVLALSFGNLLLGAEGLVALDGVH